MVEFGTSLSHTSEKFEYRCCSCRMCSIFPDLGRQIYHELISPLSCLMYDVPQKKRSSICWNWPCAWLNGVNPTTSYASDQPHQLFLMDFLFTRFMKSKRVITTMSSWCRLCPSVISVEQRDMVEKWLAIRKGKSPLVLLKSASPAVAFTKVLPS